MKLLDDVREVLPTDRDAATLVGRVHDPQESGPSVVAVRGDELVDLTDTVPTLTDLLEHRDPVGLARGAAPRKSWPLASAQGSEAPLAPHTGSRPHRPLSCVQHRTTNANRRLDL